LGVYILQVISGACGAENVDNMWRTYVQELHQDTTGNKCHKTFYEKVFAYNNKTVADKPDMPLPTVDTFS